MRKQLITATAGGKKEGRNKEDGREESEVGRLVLRRMPMDAASLHSGEDNRQREGGKDIRTGWGNKNVRTQEGSNVKHQMVQSVC